ncbi:autotransporter YejO, partial [Escherichia coli]
RLGQFDIKDGIANNMLLENGGSLRVEENDFAYNTTVDNGALLEVMDGGTATGVDKKAGGKLIVSTNALEVSGTNSKGQFSIKDGVSKNYELDDGSGLIVMEGTQAIDTILDEHATMQSLGRDTGTRVQAHAVYDLGRSVQNGNIKYSSNAISENMVIDNGRANVWTGTMVNVTVRGNEGIIDAMALELNFYTPATFLGDVVVSDGASLRTHGAVDTSKADVSIEESFWAIIADINNINQNTRLNLANLVMSDGTVVMMAEPVTRSSVTASAENFTTLTTNTLSGNGNFYMRTDMANHQSDQLNVTGQATGDFKIFVTDTGASPAAGDSLTLVTTGGGDAAFTLGNAGGVVDIGTYEYTLLDNGNHSWSLAENRAQITPSTTDVLNMAAAQPLVFDAELDTVRERLGSVKGVNYDTAMWSSAINTRNNVTTDAGAGFEQTLTGLTLGIDSRFSREESSTIRGLFFGYSHSDIGFDRGGKGNVDSYTLGAYAGWEHQNGAYVDGVVKVDRFANTIHGKMSNGATAFGDYSSNGAGAHVESGFRWVDGLWSVRPYLAFTGFTTDGQDYTLSNGMRADVGNTRILRAEAGTAVSYHMDLQNGTTLEPWLKAAVRQEYADSNQVKVNDDGKFNNDVAGTRGVYQAGIRSSFTPTLSGHLSVSYGNGAGVESPWNTQAGVVWTF